MTPSEASLRAAFERPSPFYRARLHGIGVETADQLGEAWSRMPPTRRRELVDDQLSHLPHGTRRCADAAAPVRAGSTGTGAELMVLTWTASDLARERAAGVRCLRSLGIRPGMRVANTLPGALSTPGSLLLGDVVDELGALDIPLGEVTDARSAEAAWKLIGRVRAEVLVSPRAGAAQLLAQMPPDGAPSLRGVVWIVRSADPMVVEEPEIPGFGGWVGAALAIPEAACFVAIRCPRGIFHADDDCVVEILNEEGSLADCGELTVTPRERDTLVLRYASELSVAAEECDCGRDGASFRLVDGREQESHPWI